MPFGFLIPLLLAGLAGLAIPPLIHLLNRRRYQVVDWGAMQFLQISETTRRRLLIEELLLMALRMGLIGVMVLALAGPFVQMAWFNQLLGQVGVRPNRDVVIVVDGSYSMGYEGEGSSAQEKAKDWIKNFVDDLTPGDTVAVLQAKEVVVPVLAEPSGDFDQVRHVIDRLPAPAGGVDWPQAVHAAWQLLDAKSQRTRRDIIVLSDGQRFGWADGHSLLRWELLAQPLRQNGDLPPPQLFVFNLEPKRPAEPPNWSLAPLTVSRTVAAAGQDIRFRTALRLSGQKAYRPPFRVRLEIDGKPARDLQPPQTAQLEKGQVPLTFHQEFATPGSHLVSVIVEPDPPKEQRSKDYVVKDRLPGDNRQDFALEVVRALPVLLVDGDPKPNAKLRGTDFLRDALSPKIDPKPRVLAQVVPIQELNEAALSQPLRPDQPDTRPRVLILVNVERLSARQNQAIEQFLADGGGVLVALGERCDASAYNDLLYRGGQGWLPARLEEAVGDVDAPEKAASPLQETLFHPALDLFREMKKSDFTQVRWPRYWKLTPPSQNAPAVPVALLTTSDPLLVERPFRGGRVLLSAAPLDDTWYNTLPKSQAFAPLAHELVYYLAGARTAEHNLQPGQPIRYRPTDEESARTAPTPHEIILPNGETKTLTGDSWPLVHEDTREPGIYRIQGHDGKPVYYVVQPDPREADLTPASDDDRAAVANILPMTYATDPAETAPALVTADHRQELWWWFLLGVIGLLCGEIWLTRRIVKNR